MHSPAKPIATTSATPFEPVTLEGRVVRLEPLLPAHAAPLWAASEQEREETFRWFPWAMETLADLERYINERILPEQAQGLTLPFITVERKSNQIVGSTHFMNMDAANRRVEIGSTWVVPAWQRTAVNTEAKYLMLGHAFETWHCLRVELKTDGLNARSRKAILRLGAKEEGTLRKHVICWNGRARDTVYYAITDTEWPDVKMKLEQRLAR